MEMGDVKKEIVDIKRLVLNEGQIPDVPKNPRLIKDSRYRALVKSIQDDPEMLDLREIIVYPYDNKLVAIAGNMRLQACRELKYKQVSCKILPPETPAEKLRAYAIKDNVSGGEWDWDLLANDWELPELKEFGFEDVDLGWMEDAALIEEDIKEKEIDENSLETEHECPKCGYKWS